MSEEESRVEQEGAKTEEKEEEEETGEDGVEDVTQQQDQDQQQSESEVAADEPSDVRVKDEGLSEVEGAGVREEEGRGEEGEGEREGEEGRAEEGEGEREGGDEKGGEGEGEEGEGEGEGEEEVKEGADIDSEGREGSTAEAVASDGREETEGGGERELGEEGDETEGGGERELGEEEDERRQRRETESEDVKDDVEHKAEVQGGDDEVGVVSAVMSPSDISRGVSASRTPLENITEEEGEGEGEVDREELIKNCKEALEQQRRLKSENAQLQHKIAEYLSHKNEEKPDPGRNVTDHEKRYLQCMSALDRLELELQQRRYVWSGEQGDMKELRDSRQGEVEGESDEFLKYQAAGIREAVDSRTGRRMTSSDITRLQTAQTTNNQAVFQARLENIKLTNKVERLESLLKQKEELAEGLHMIDFEQLKISNVDLGEKVEERNEDIRKLTGKVRATVQVLTHVKEKLHFLQEENEKKKEFLEQLDSDLAKRRDILTRLKQTRDSLRLDNQRLRQRGGLVCHTDLLRDFEDRQDQNAELRSRLEKLQTQHSHNSLQCSGLRGKIEQTRHLQHHLH